MTAGLADDRVTAIAIDGTGHKWFGTRGGVSEFDGETWTTYTSEDGLVRDYVNAIAIDEAGHKWFGTDGGVSKFDGQTWTTYTTKDGLVYDHVNAIASDGAGHTWFGTGSGFRRQLGVSKFDGHTWTTYTSEDGLAHNYVKAVAAERAGHIWFGTVDGVSEFDGQTWTTYTPEDGLAYKWVNAIAVDEAGHKWFGTEGGGVSKFDGQTWTTYTVADGLASNVVYAIAIDEAGPLWFGTSGGVSKFDGTTWTTYTRRDGLPHNRVYAIAADEAGHKWFGFGEKGGGVSEFDDSNWAPSPPPAARSVLSTSPPLSSVKLAGPFLVDSEAGRLYTAGQVGGKRQTFVLATTDGRLLATYDIAGPFALDSVHGWLYVDQGDEGLAVVNTRTDTLQAIVPLPEGWRNLPQADLATGQGLAFRDNVVYFIDPEKGAVVGALPTDLTTFITCTAGPYTLPLPIIQAQYDNSRRILYAYFHTFICDSSMGGNFLYTLVSYDLTSGGEIARQGRLPPSNAIAFGGYLYDSSFHWSGAAPRGYISIWRDGKPWFTSSDWCNKAGNLVVEPTRQQLYHSIGETVHVFDTQTMALTMVLPQPEGALVACDSKTDQLYFLADGQLQLRPGSAIQPPVPEPLVASHPPTTPVRSLVVSPYWRRDQTLFGIWDKQGDPWDACSALSRRVWPYKSGLLYVSSDGGQTWSWSRGGLRGSSELVTTLAVSPDYARDQTLLAGVVGLGVFKSTDGGRLWQPSGAGLSHMKVGRIFLSPGFANDQTAFAQAWGGLYRSRDGGSTWQAFDVDLDLIALSPEFDQDGTLMGVDNVYGESPELFISRDGGDHWEQVGDLPAGAEMLSLAPLFAKWRVVFTYGWNDTLYRSSDGGRSWEPVLTDLSFAKPLQLVYAPDIEENRPVFLLVEIDNRTDPSSSGGVLYHSRDGGLTWQVFELPEGISPTVLAISPHFAQDRTLFIGTEGGQVLTLEVTK